MVKGCMVPKCGQKDRKMSYEELIRHLKNECQHINIRCPSKGCFKMITKSHSSKHFMEECKKCVECEHCKKVMSYEYSETQHDCIGKVRKENEILVGKLIKRDEKIALLRKQNICLRKKLRI